MIQDNTTQMQNEDWPIDLRGEFVNCCIFISQNSNSLEISLLLLQTLQKLFKSEFEIPKRYKLYLRREIFLNNTVPQSWFFSYTQDINVSNLKFFADIFPLFFCRLYFFFLRIWFNKKKSVGIFSYIRF